MGVIPSKTVKSYRNEERILVIEVKSNDMCKSAESAAEIRMLTNNFIVVSEGFLAHMTVSCVI